MSQFFGIHLPFSGYGPTFGVGDTIPGAAAGIQAMSRPGIPQMGGPSFNPLGSAVAAKLGLRGLAGAADGFGSVATPGTPGQPGQSAPGGISGWLQSHGDALKGIGGLLQGGASVYGALSQQQLEKKRLQMERERDERTRRDQEAAAAAVAPGYAALLQAMAGKVGAPTGG